MTTPVNPDAITPATSSSTTSLAASSASSSSSSSFSASSIAPVLARPDINTSMLRRNLSQFGLTGDEPLNDSMVLGSPRAPSTSSSLSVSSVPVVGKEDEKKGASSGPSIAQVVQRQNQFIGRLNLDAPNDETIRKFKVAIAEAHGKVDLATTSIIADKYQLFAKALTDAILAIKEIQDEGASDENIAKAAQENSLTIEVLKQLI